MEDPNSNISTTGICSIIIIILIPLNPTCAGLDCFHQMSLYHFVLAEVVLGLLQPPPPPLNATTAS
jgi:hypothetical protein